MPFDNDPTITRHQEVVDKNDKKVYHGPGFTVGTDETLSGLAEKLTRERA